MFDAPKSKELTQGSVFTCAYAENYNDGPVLGLVITARCDVAQNKVPTFSYVPVVTLESWVLKDGAEIILDRIEADAENQFRNFLKDRNLSNSLLQSHTPQQIYDAHFKPTEEDKAKKRQCEKYRSTVSVWAATRNLRLDHCDTSELKAHLLSHEDKVDTVVKELVGNRLAGYYLLRGLDLDLDGSRIDCVALLREVHHIPANVAQQIAKGISAADWRTQSAPPRSLCPRFLDIDDYSLPIGRLKSPWIEHVMQNFALLFSRIGVKDNDFKEVKKSLSGIGLGGC